MHSAAGFGDDSPSSPAVPDPAEELADGEVWEEVDLDECVLSGYSAASSLVLQRPLRACLKVTILRGLY